MMLKKRYLFLLFLFLAVLGNESYGQAVFGWVRINLRPTATFDEMNTLAREYITNGIGEANPDEYRNIIRRLYTATPIDPRIHNDRILMAVDNAFNTNQDQPPIGLVTRILTPNYFAVQFQLNQDDYRVLETINTFQATHFPPQLQTPLINMRAHVAQRDLNLNIRSYYIGLGLPDVRPLPPLINRNRIRQILIFHHMLPDPEHAATPTRTIRVAQPILEGIEPSAAYAVPPALMNNVYPPLREAEVVEIQDVDVQNLFPYEGVRYGGTTRFCIQANQDRQFINGSARKGGICDSARFIDITPALKYCNNFKQHKPLLLS